MSIYVNKLVYKICNGFVNFNLLGNKQCLAKIKQHK